MDLEEIYEFQIKAHQHPSPFELKFGLHCKVMTYAWTMTLSSQPAAARSGGRRL
jgi:hypothetical protein